MHATLRQLVETIKAKPSEVQNDRPIVEVPQHVLDAFTRLVGANAVLKVAKTRQDAEEKQVKEELLGLFVESLYEHGTVPANPKLQIEDSYGRPDMAGIFQVQQRFKVKMPQAVEGDTEIKTRLVSALVEAGLARQDAERLYDNEIDATRTPVMRDFFELLNGHYEGEGQNRQFVEATADEKAVGQKLLDFFGGTETEPLTDAERQLVFRLREQVEVKKGFLHRLKNY